MPGPKPAAVTLDNGRRPWTPSRHAHTHNIGTILCLRKVLSGNLCQHATGGRAGGMVAVASAECGNDVAALLSKDDC